MFKTHSVAMYEFFCYSHISCEINNDISQNEIEMVVFNNPKIRVAENFVKLPH